MIRKAEIVSTTTTLTILGMNFQYISVHTTLIPTIRACLFLYYKFFGTLNCERESWCNIVSAWPAILTPESDGKYLSSAGLITLVIYQRQTEKSNWSSRGTHMGQHFETHQKHWEPATSLGSFHLKQQKINTSLKTSLHILWFHFDSPQDFLLFNKMLWYDFIKQWDKFITRFQIFLSNI